MPKKITYEEFINRSIDKHGKKFDYSEVKYINQYTPVKIKCPIHGYFEQIPKSHMNGNDCKKCAQLKIADKIKGVKKINKLEHNTIIDRLESMYDYDYSKCVITGTRGSAVISNILCPIHGYFSKNLNNHMRQNQGCNICGKNNLSKKIFVDRANIIHQNKYDYSKFSYSNNRENSTIICPEHGDFNQKPDKHLIGQGCPVCYRDITSKGEKFIRNFLKSKNINFEEQKQIPGTKLRMDFFLPEKNICIEYDGIQHFEPRSRFGGDKEFEIQKVRDSRKNDYCNKKNIRLIRISYKDYSKLNTILNTVLNENIINFKEFILFF